MNRNKSFIVGFLISAFISLIEIGSNAENGSSNNTYDGLVPSNLAHSHLRLSPPDN